MDNFSAFPTTPISPARSAFNAIPSDATDLPHVSRAVFIGQAGNLSVEMADGDVVTFENLPSGSLLPIRVTKILNSDTSASGIVTLW